MISELKSSVTARTGETMHRPSTVMATVLTDAEHTLLVISLIGGFNDTVLV